MTQKNIAPGRFVCINGCTQHASQAATLAR